jgi:flagellar basal body-associated protein FliL
MFDNSRVGIQKIFKRRRIMEEKKGSKSTIWIVLFVFALLVIVAMGMLILKLKDEKSVAESVAELKTSVAELAESTTKAETDIKTSDETINNYYTNFTTSVAKEIGTDNKIDVRLDNYDDNHAYGEITVNNKKEAHIYLSTISDYSDPNNLKKVADDVVNVWFCQQGQVHGDDYIIFSKTDGSVTCVRFRLTSEGKVTFDPQERVVKGITNISAVVPIEGNDFNGIGGYGVLFIKLDGTCYPYAVLDNLVK